MENIALTTMSVKSAGFNPAQILALPEEQRKPIALGRIFGIAHGLKFGEDNKGNAWVALTGDFIAQCYAERDKQYLGGKLFLPEGIHDKLVAGVEGGGVVNDKGKPIYNDVEFAFEVYVKPAKNPIGYSYECKILVDVAQSDPMTALQNRLGALPALPAPKEEAKTDKKK